MKLKIVIIVLILSASFLYSHWSNDIHTHPKYKKGEPLYGSWNVEWERYDNNRDIGFITFSDDLEKETGYVVWRKSRKCYER